MNDTTDLSLSTLPLLDPSLKQTLTACFRFHQGLRPGRPFGYLLDPAAEVAAPSLGGRSKRPAPHLRTAGLP